MDVLMILIAVIGLVASIANKKKTAQAKQQRAATQGREAAGPNRAPAQSTQNRTSPAKAPAASSKLPSGGPSKFPTATPKRNAAQRQQPLPVTPTYGGTPRYTHVVTSTLEGGHTHTESSMTGEEPCPPPKAAVVQHPAEAGKASAPETGELLSFTPNSVLQGVLYAEILGKPKAIQRH